MKKTNTMDIGLIKPKVIIYGPSGIGKTSQANTLDPKRTLVISAESGLLPLTGKDFTVYEIEKWDDLLDIWKELKSPEALKKWDNIFVDSLTDLAEVCKIHIVTQERPKVRGKIDKIYDDQLDMKDWGLYTDKMRKFIRSFRDLPYTVIFTALESQEKDESTGSMMFNISLPGKKFLDSLPGYFDEVFRMVIKGNGDIQERYLLTEHTGKSLAKDRSGKLDKFEIPNLKAIIKKIQDGFKTKKEEVK